MPRLSGPSSAAGARRLLAAPSIAFALAVTPVVLAPPSALASKQQQAMFQEDVHLLADPAGTLAQLRPLGVQIVRVSMRWQAIAPDSGSRNRPSGFNATDPGAYPAGNWLPYDKVVESARADGITVDFVLTGGAPRWALGSGAPQGRPPSMWKPSARAFGSFVRAVGTRYSGRYTPAGSSTPLPPVGFWSIWNEPNFGGGGLAPQAIDGSKVSVAPHMYRDLLDAAWSSLQRTGHGRDTIVMGELDARGASGPVTRRAPQGLPGNYAATKPLEFVRTLYCVDSAFRELRGAAAAARGCPRTAAASRRFRGAHPALFAASGFGDHPYPDDRPPNVDSSRDRDLATFPQLPRLEGELDRLQRIYGSRKRFQIYNDEYGYITNPPNPRNRVSQSTAAYYINWSEYLSWRNPRLQTTSQYLLYDPDPEVGVPEYGGFATGLLTSRGVQKPGYDAYRLPLYLPVTSTRRGRSLEVWGCARPARYQSNDPPDVPPSVQIQFQSGSRGAFATLRTVPVTDPHGYFDVREVFRSSGSVRLAWSYPTGDPAYSRVVRVTVR